MGKLLGAVLVMTGCSGIAFLAMAAHKREERALFQLEQILSLFINELSYREIPLLQLLCMVKPDGIGETFVLLASELEKHHFSDVDHAMDEVLSNSPRLPVKTATLLSMLASSLGRYDLAGQLQSLEAVKAECARIRSAHCENQETKLRNYRTIGICAGVMLAILLF